MTLRTLMAAVLAAALLAGCQPGSDPKLPAGADFQLVTDGTTAHLDARYLIELDDGARLFVHNTALRHASPEVTARLLSGEPVPPESVYFRCQPRFETGDARWRWLGERQFVGTGARLPDAVRLSFWQVR